MKCGIFECKKKAVWIHTYYASLSVCGEHYKTAAARMLRSLPSEARTKASRENGKKGGAPKKLVVKHLPSDYPKKPYLTAEEAAEYIAEQEAKFGEQRTEHLYE